MVPAKSFIESHYQITFWVERISKQKYYTYNSIPFMNCALDVIIMAIIKVNIGCGTTTVDGWINYDSSLGIFLCRHRFIKRLLFAFKLISKRSYETFWPSNIIRRDVRKGLPLPDESVDFIYCSHFLEHLSHEEAVRLISECRRVLKRGGWIRLVCPDLRILARQYLAGDLDFILFHATHKAELSQAFIDSLCLLDNRSISEKLFSSGFSHVCMYDFNSIAKLLNNCGFRVIEKRHFREGMTPDIDKLDNRPDESLFVEAQKL